MEWYFYLLAPLLGLVTGIINTMAGSGSLLTLPFFMFSGLPATVANGTNRVGILGQSTVTIFVMRDKLRAQGPSPWLVVIPSVISGILGAYVASIMPPDVLKGIIGIVLLLLIVPILTNSEKWLRRDTPHDDYLRKPLLIFLMSIIGFYAGFIQAGSGIFMLTVLVLIGGRPLQHANFLKNLITLCINIPAFAVYLYQGQVSWAIGLMVLLGQSLGGWVAAKFIGNNSKANIWTRYLLIFMLVLSASKMIWDYFSA